jgi:1-acyl-sn-glycerol-3-phosphate acyltransferase
VTQDRSAAATLVGQPATATLVERQVLDIVAGLVVELGGTRTAAPALDDSLDRDLGISSLERVELLLRIERVFGIRLSDAVMAEAGTPKDLAAAVLSASPAAAEAIPTPTQPATPGQPAPTSAQTLVEVLRWHAERTPDRTHIHLRLENGAEEPITYGQLLSGANAVAGGLHALGVAAGDTVALMLRTEHAYFEAFFGALMAGAVPVPLYPPVRRDEILDYARRQRGILRNAGARVLVTFPETERIAALIRAQVPSLETITTVDRLAAAGADTVLESSAGTQGAALLQYTSGSTGSPKGVLLTHANVLANIRAIGEAIAVRSVDVTVSWLPLYHDMGLIGAWLGSLYFGVPIVLMSPLAFLSRPARWLWSIHAHHGTMAPAPNFAFDLCVHKIADDEIKGLDLSSWRLAFNGSEVVSPDTIDRFTRRFAPYGFKADAMCPVYGLAESSVGLTVSVLGRRPRVDLIAREPFERARAVHAAPPDEVRPLQLVSCGRPLPGHEVRIADASGQPFGERVEGRIQFRGPSVTSGYFRDPGATRAVMHDGWMDSGDLGYWADGELFITGREKDLIILGGRNVYAQEVEDTATTVAGIRKGCAAAFGVHDPVLGTERLIVVAETRERDLTRRAALRQAVIDRIVTAVGVPPDVVVIADPRTVLKTSSGKIRRSATRDAYVHNTLGRGRSAAGQWASLLLTAVAGRSQRLASLIGRGLFTAYVLAILLITLPVLWVYLLLGASSRRAERAAKRWSRLALRLCGIRVRITGLENLKNIRAGILIANHASYIDPVVLMAAIPPEFHFIAKRRLADYPLIGTVIRKAGHVTIEKADVSHRLAGAEDIAALLAKDELLMIFPEGTFLRPAGLLPFRLGAFKGAVETGRPIVPIALRGTRHILPDGTWLLRHGPIDVTIGAPFRPGAQGWQEMVRLRDAARDEIARGCGESSGRV